MAAKHRKRSRLQKSISRGTTGLATAAVGATSVGTAIVTGTTPAIAPSVDLMALVTPANSTAQFFAGTKYYGTDYSAAPPVGYGEQQVVPFLLGPQGIADAIRQHKDDTDPTGVTSSGWGAGQTGTALGSMSDDDLENVDLVILDNNTNRAGGGFWTTYNVFAPLLLTSAEPTPNDLDVTVWDVGYEYNINGNAVTYPANVVSLGNSLAAYVYGYGGEQNAELPIHMQDGVHYIVDPATGRIISQENLNDPAKYPDRATPVTTTYVTFQSGTWDDQGTVSQADDEFVPDGPPLLRPLRLLPGGDIIADTLKPAVTEIVNAGYKDNQPIPTDPTQTRPMGLGIPETVTMLNRLPGAIQQGLDDGAETAQEDFSQPGNFITKPIGEAGKLPFVSSLPSTLTNSTVNTANSKNALTGLKKTGTSSSAGGERPRPLKKIADDFSSSLKKFANEVSKNKPAEPSDDAE